MVDGRWEMKMPHIVRLLQPSITRDYKFGPNKIDVGGGIS